MKSLLGIDQQRDYVRRLQLGWTAASVSQLNALTEAERFRILDELTQFSEPESDLFLTRMKLFLKKHGLK
jgi:hypothetical protein